MFLKGPGAVIGHRGFTAAAGGVSFMHYECELAVVIGQTGAQGARGRRDAARRGLHRVQRLRHSRLPRRTGIAPNLRVKEPRHWHRARPVAGGCGADVRIRTTWRCTLVNGKVTQRGHTGNMINDIPALIEYLQRFHDARARRRDPHRHAGGRGQRETPATRSSPRSTASALVNTIVGDEAFRRNPPGSHPMQVNQHLINGKSQPGRQRHLRDRQPGTQGRSPKSLAAGRPK